MTTRSHVLLARSRARAAAALTIGALLVGACSTGTGPQASPPDTGSSTGASTQQAATALAFAGPTADDYGRLLVSRDDLTELQPVEILDVDTDADNGQRLLVSFEMPSHHCHGVHTAVVESDTEVVLDLQIGRRPGVSLTACVDGVYPYATELPLAAPLGDRVVGTAAERTADQAGGGIVADGPDPDGAVASPDGATDPAAVDPALIPADAVERYLGHHVEDGVEWALANDRPWRILSTDGEMVSTDSATDPERLSFTVVGDVIVALEWS